MRKTNFFLINFHLSCTLKASCFSHTGIRFAVANGVGITGINTQHVTYGPGHLDRCQRFTTARAYFSCSAGLYAGRRSALCFVSVMSTCRSWCDDAALQRRDASQSPSSTSQSVQTRAHQHTQTLVRSYATNRRRTYARARAQNTQKLHRAPQRPARVLSTIPSPMTIQFTRCCLQQAISRIGVPVNHRGWKISCLPVISGLEASWPKG